MSEPDGRSRVLLDTGDHAAHGRVARWLPDAAGNSVALQLHLDGHENGGLHIVPAAHGREAWYVPDASPHPAVVFVGELLLYSSGSRTEHELRVRRLPGGTPRTVALPVPGPVRLSLHTGPGGHLLLRTRAPASPAARWWCTRWDGSGTPDWQELPLAGLPVTAFAVGPNDMYIGGNGLLGLDLVSVSRGCPVRLLPLVPLGPLVPPPSEGGSEGTIRALRVLDSGSADAAPSLAVLRQLGTTRRLDVQRVIAAHGAVPDEPESDAVASGERGFGEPGSGAVASDAVATADEGNGEPAASGFTWHARLRIGPTARRADGGPGDGAWVLVDDPRFGAVSHRVTVGAPCVPRARRSVLRAAAATSGDGATVPLTICDPPFVSAGQAAPTLITVYGGFGVSLEPSWDPIVAAWLAAGGRIAWVHARGGGELGPRWARAGRGPGKSGTVDDLCAAARYLQSGGEAGPGQLAALSASNGGMVVAAAMVRASHLFAATVCVAPLTDMARYHIGGLGNLWHAEYGDPADRDALRALLGYSPYHRVRDGTPYPATLFVTGGNDARVRPWHAWKLCAALQEATSSDAPVLLDHHEDGGHDGRSGSAARALNARFLALLAGRTGLRAPSTGNRSANR
nr:prolyl oligopeptidase family serine peptidase [Streptomyces flavofungini]